MLVSGVEGMRGWVGGRNETSVSDKAQIVVDSVLRIVDVLMAIAWILEYLYIWFSNVTKDEGR